MLALIRLLALGTLVMSVSASGSDMYARPIKTGSLADGLYLQFTSVTPECSTTPSGWLLIPQAQASSIALALTLVAQSRMIGISTDGTKNGAGYCFVIGIYDAAP